MKTTNRINTIVVRQLFKGILFFAVILIVGANLIGCTNPSYLTVRPDIGSRAWLTIAVVPFAGDVRFRDVATDIFTLHMLKQNKFTVIEPDTVRIKARSIIAMVEGNTITVLEAQKIGQLMNADAVIIGTVTSYNTGVTLNGWATVKLVDTRSGEVLASSHKPSGLLFAYSEHQCVVKATERAAEDMLSVLDQIQQKKDITPTEQRNSTQREPIIPVKSEMKESTKL